MGHEPGSLSLINIYTVYLIYRLKERHRRSDIMGDDERRVFEGGGFYVSEGGIVMGGGRKFGMLSQWDGSFVSEDGTRYRNMRSAILSDDGKTMSLEMDGGSTCVSGVPLAKGDKAHLPNGGKMPSSISALEDMFSYLYPFAESQVYMDELSERPYIDMSMFGQDSEGFVPISDVMLAVYHADIERRLDRLGLEGKYPIYKIRDEMLDILVGRNRRNLFREWVESHEWDGVPRVRTWFKDTFGATAPALKDQSLEDRYLGDVAETWFIGAVRRMYRETKHEIVPVLIGGQGIMKGTAIQYTAGKDEWYVECTEDVKQTAKFLDATRGRIIVELSEGTQIRGPDSEALKAFISKSEDQLRKPYAHFDESFIRHFVLIASTNIDNIFTDITGNRRFFPMYCDPDRATREFSVDRTVGQYDVEQVWAEALQMYKDGHKWYASSAMAETAQIMQEFYTQENSNVSVIEDWLDDPMNHYDEIGSRVTKTDIMQRVFGLAPDTLPSKDYETAYRAWTNATKSWKKVTNSVRINGRVSRAYERVSAPDAPKAAIKRLKVVEGSNGRPPEDVLRQQAEEDGLEPDMPFVPRGLTKEALEHLCSEGYIYYMTRTDGSREWFFGESP